MTRAAKTAWQKAKRAEAALLAGRVPHRTGRPPSGLPRKKRRSKARVEEACAPLTHPLLEEAQRIVGPLHASHGRAWRFASEVLHEDLIAEAALALCEGSDPHVAVKELKRREAQWLRVTTWLASEDGKGRLDDASPLVA